MPNVAGSVPSGGSPIRAVTRTSQAAETPRRRHARLGHCSGVTPQRGRRGSQEAELRERSGRGAGAQPNAREQVDSRLAQIVNLLELEMVARALDVRELPAVRPRPVAR